jgi:EpsI family protein
MVPLPEVAIADLNFRLKMLAANWGVAIADFFGVLVVQSASTVHIFDESGGLPKTLVIANVCNGLRTLISLLSFGAMYCYVCRLRGLWRAGLFLMTIPVAVAVNSLRIASLIIVADIWDAKTATGKYHDISGILIFVAAFLLMFGLERLVLWARRVVGRPAKVEPLFAKVRRDPADTEQWERLALAPHRVGGWAAAAVMLAVGAGAWWLGRPTAPPEETGQTVSKAVPMQLEFAGMRWQGWEDRLTEHELRVLETTANLCLYRHYRTGGRSEVPEMDLTVIFSPDNRKGTHPPDLCLEGNGQNITAKGDQHIGGIPERGEVDCRELITRTGSGAQLYYLYVYKCGERYTTSFVRQQATILVNGLLARDASGALVRVSTRVLGNDLEGARRRSVALMAAAIPHLDRALQGR